MCSPELQMLTSNLIGKWGEKVRIEVQSSSHLGDLSAFQEGNTCKYKLSKKSIIQLH